MKMKTFRCCSTLQRLGQGSTVHQSIRIRVLGHHHESCIYISRRSCNCKDSAKSQLKIRRRALGNKVRCIWISVISRTSLPCIGGFRMCTLGNLNDILKAIGQGRSDRNKSSLYKDMTASSQVRSAFKIKQFFFGDARFVPEVDVRDWEESTSASVLQVHLE